MTQLFLGIFLSLPLSTPAQADAFGPSGHRWFCTADGYDFNGRLRSVSGRLMPTKALAERDAVRACHGFYSNCGVASCFQQR